MGHLSDAHMMSFAVESGPMRRITKSIRSHKLILVLHRSARRTYKMRSIIGLQTNYIYIAVPPTDRIKSFHIGPLILHFTHSFLVTFSQHQSCHITMAVSVLNTFLLLSALVALSSQVFGLVGPLPSDIRPSFYASNELKTVYNPINPPSCTRVLSLIHI